MRKQNMRDVCLTYLFVLQEGEVLDVSELFSQVLAGVRPRLPDGKRDCPSTLRSLAERCWSEDPLQVRQMT
jgi:hypothetical protein